MSDVSNEDLQFFVDNIDRLRDDPVFFSKELLHIDLHKGQQQIVSAIKDNRLLAALCPRRWGKTFAFSIAAAWMCSTNKNFRVVCLAPTQRQANELFQAISRVILSSVLSEYVTQNTATKLKLSNGSSIESVPGRNPDALRGMGLSLLLCDEAAYISSGMFNSIYATIANVGKKTIGKLVLISTPGAKSGQFWKAFQEGSPYKTFEMSYLDAVYDDGRLHMSDEELEMFADLCGGKDSAEFKREFMCEWSNASDSFFDVEGIEKSLIPNLPQIKYGIPGRKYSIGVDVALSQDWTIINILDFTDPDNLEVVRYVRFTGKTTDQIMDAIYQETVSFQPSEILIDDGKIGAAIVSHLKMNYPKYNFKPFNFNTNSKVPLLTDLNIAMNKGILRIPENDTIREELLSFMYSQNLSTGHLKLNGVGCHDDFCIAISLSLRAAHIFSRRSGFVIVSDKTTNNSLNDDDNDASNSPQIRRSTAKSLTF